MMHDPHSLIEGVIIASYAIRANRAYIYIRGEAVHAARRLRHAVAEAYEAGLPRHEHPRLRLRPGPGRPQWSGRVHLRRGDGAAGLAGGLPRPAAAAPAVPGHARPLRLPDRGQQRRHDRQRAVHRARRRRPGGRRMGTEKSSGPMIYSLSGRIANPGQYECSLGITLRELIELAGGMLPGHELKFWTPGGSSHAAADRRAPRRAAGLRGRGRGRHRSSAPRRRRSSPTRTARSTRRTGGSSSTTTSRAASAPRAARATTGWCGIYRRILVRRGHPRGPRHAAGHLRQHPRPRRSAASATARPAR